MVLSISTMALQSDAEGKMSSKKFSDDANGFSMLKLVRVQKGMSSDLMDHLLRYVECQKLPIGVLRQISEKHNCSKRTV